MALDRDIEIEHDTSEFVAELRRLADALESGGEFTISIDGEDVTIPEGARLSIAHERKDGEVELEFQITWETDEDEDEDEEDEDGDGDEDGDDPKTASA